jgi:hypothetical protein
MTRLWTLFKAWHAAALAEHLEERAVKRRHQYGSGAVTTRRPA